jgi:hypothetical protein
MSICIGAFVLGLTSPSLRPAIQGVGKVQKIMEHWQLWQFLQLISLQCHQFAKEMQEMHAS